MQASAEILAVWQKFDPFPMETLTKAWHRGGQRTVAEMKAHREQYGTSGNCFDLAIWLLEEFRAAGITAYAVGHDLGTGEAHVAVVAEDEQGSRYLCDLGDLWLQPILLDPKRSEFSGERLAGFFPAAEVQVAVEGDRCLVRYFRPNGKQSRQEYDLTKIAEPELLAAAEACQQDYRLALVELRVPHGSETAHWEFGDWESFLSTSEGLYPEEKLSTIEAWVERIHARTGIAKAVLQESLAFYQNSMK
ncbi:hypothetical protein EV586_10555 [Tumebacillus sp. BK434]|uniref:hypothetical protein n=1 Tax=Tumebacillus sp. BK434 TaxID=2512169 RepID=UPI00104B8E18|nr:hypothetical protein [Tumebacillus sp. BK434]TCP53711.1 hypothetical protein EV586_10555 [Tumebacillus sp. BK434]